MKKLALSFAAALGSIALVGAVQGTAQAAPAEAGNTAVGAATTAPDCVTYEDPINPFSNVQKVYLTSGCSSTVSVLGVTYYGTTACVTLAPGETRMATYYDFGALEGVSHLKTC